MISDIRGLHAKVLELHNGVNAVRRRYPDQDLMRYAEISEVMGDAEKLHEICVWLSVIADALHDQELKKEENNHNRRRAG
jgi:hypothetical protein